MTHQPIKLTCIFTDISKSLFECKYKFYFILFASKKMENKDRISKTIIEFYNTNMVSNNFQVGIVQDVATLNLKPQVFEPTLDFGL